MKQNKQKIKLNEFTNGIRPSARVGHSRFNMEDLAYEIRDILKKLEKNGETLNNLIAQTLPWMDFNKMGEAIQTLGAETRDRASQLLSHYDPDDYAEKYDPEPDNNVNENKQTTNINKNMKKQTIKLNESQLRQIIRESIMNVIEYEPDGVYKDLGDYEKIGPFVDGFAPVVNSNRKYNFIDKEYGLLSPNLWFDEIREWDGVYGRVKLVGKGWNWLTKNGELLFPNLWFYYITPFHEDYAVAYINSKKCNLIDADGNMVFPEAMSEEDLLEKVYWDSRNSSWVFKQPS